MQFLRKPIQIVRTNLRAYLIISALLYGLCLLGFGIALLFPELTADRLAGLEDDGTADLIAALLDDVWLFALVILAVNVLQFGALSVVLPSMIVPFSGIAIAAYRAVIIGTSLAPTSETAWVTLIPHSLTWLIEFQAYILLSLGAYLVGRAWLRPRSVGAIRRRDGYLRGLRQLGWLSLPALILLIIGAIYEAFSLIHLVGPLVDLIIGD